MLEDIRPNPSKISDEGSHEQEVQPGMLCRCMQWSLLWVVWAVREVAAGTQPPSSYLPCAGNDFLVALIDACPCEFARSNCNSASRSLSLICAALIGSATIIGAAMLIDATPLQAARAAPVPVHNADWLQVGFAGC